MAAVKPTKSHIIGERSPGRAGSGQEISNGDRSNVLIAQVP